MNILITGIPGTGKTTIAKSLAKKLKLKYFSEKDFLQKGDYKIETEYGTDVKVVNLQKFSNSVNSVLRKENSKKGIVLDGLVLPYIVSNLRIKLDLIFILKLDSKIITVRLKKRKYPEVKILDNLFVQENSVLEMVLEKCQKKLRGTKPKICVLEISGNKKKDLLICSQIMKSYGVKNI